MTDLSQTARQSKPTSSGVPTLLLHAEDVTSLLSATADLVLTVGQGGLIDMVVVSSPEVGAGEFAALQGTALAASVADDSTEKVAALLADARDGAAPRPRHVNMIVGDGRRAPVLFTAVGTEDDRVVMLGRDLSPVASLQQRLFAAQQSLERDYARLRKVETRYRALFETAGEAILIVDAQTRRVVEANSAAAAVLSAPLERMVGMPFPTRDMQGTQREVEALLMRVAATGRPENAVIDLAHSEDRVRCGASLLRHDGELLLIVRLAPVAPTLPATGLDDLQRAKVLAPEAVAIVDADGAMIALDDRALDLVQMSSTAQARGMPLDRFLGRPGVDVSILLGSAREHGLVQLYATTLRGAYGLQTTVELCVMRLAEGERERFGFLIRDVGGRVSEPFDSAGAMPPSVEHLSDLVGRVPLKELVRDTTDVIERMCIDAALKLTGDNRASAAEMLGLSRQSLYVKLRRFGIMSASDTSDD